MANDTIWGRNLFDESGRVFALLVLYRWLSLIPPVIFAIIDISARDVSTISMFALATAIGLNIFISLFSSRLNRALQRHAWLLPIDLSLVAAIAALTGGWQTPYYLYALSPLMAAAFFFEIRGAILATSAFVPLYLTAILYSASEDAASPDWLSVTVSVVGLYLISSVVGFAATLMSRLRAASRDLIVAVEDLGAAHREMEVLHSLTAALHSAADVEAVQDEVLLALTTRLGIEKAVIGLVDKEHNAITGWIGRLREEQGITLRKPLHPIQIPLSPEGGFAAQTLLEGRICRATKDFCEESEWINDQFGMSGCLVVPMRWGVQPIGILLVDLPENSENARQLRSLDAIAQQSAVALGMMMTRLRRAQESAINEERARLALEIHDTVSQSLFGIVFTLNGLLKLLPSDSDEVKSELEVALQAAESVRREIRHTIHDLWPEELTAAAFEEDLRRYVADTLQANNLQVRFDIRGDFGALSSKARRSLYRISQESLTNVVHHAAAKEVSVCVDVIEGRARLSIRDDGRGFEPKVAMAQPHGREHFGLRGIRERARSLGGTCDVFSQPGTGSSVIVDVPVGPNPEHDKQDSYSVSR